MSNKTMSIEEAMASAADQVINAREFCGNEREAAAEALVDSGFRPTRSVIAQVMCSANATWRRYQAEAGVTVPITLAERVSIHKVLESES